MKHTLPKFTLAPLALALSTQVSFAQTTETDSTDIEVVTVVQSKQAYKGDFTRLETPQAELKLDSETLKDFGAIDLTHALDLSASVARQNNFGGLWNSFAIRGFVGDENLPSNYLVNGFNAGRGFGGPRDLSGIESVEVLKGPRAALFGRGEPGGTINLVTKRPTFDESGEFRVSVGSWSRYRTDVDYTTPVSDDVAIRLVGFFEDAESFRDTVETTKHGFSPSIAWRISDDSHLTYELEYSNQEIPFDRGIAEINGDLDVLPASRFLGEPGDGPIETEVLGHQLEFQHDFNGNWSGLVGVNFRDTSLEGFATENGFGSVSEDGDFSRFRRYRKYDATYYVLRAELSGEFETAGLTHRIILGADKDEFENDQFFLRVRDGQGGSVSQSINVYNPVYGSYELPEPLPNTDRVETQESFGIYVQDQISITDSIDVRIGARFDDYKQELVSRRSAPYSVTEQTESRLSPQLGLVFKSSENLSFYAVYGENFRPLSGTDKDGNGHEPNQSTSIEAGANFLLNKGNIQGTVALFNVKQDSILVVDDVNTFTTAAIGEAESKGVEVDIVGNIKDDLSVWFSYAYIDAETKNQFFDANFGFDVEPGSPLLNVPEQQLTLQLVQELNIGGAPMSLGGAIVHVGKRNGFFGADFELPSYTTARLFSTYELTPEIELRLEVDNLFDERYYPNSFSNTWVQPGTPRNFTLSASYNF